MTKNIHTASNLFIVAKAFTTVYAVCYIISPILGLQVTGIDPNITNIILILIGIGLMYSIHSRNPYFLYSICALEIVGCVSHFLKIIPWIPEFSDTGYLIMSMLDLVQSFFIYIMNENINLQ